MGLRIVDELPSVLLGDPMGLRICDGLPSVLLRKTSPLKERLVPASITWMVGSVQDSVSENPFVHSD